MDQHAPCSRPCLHPECSALRRLAMTAVGKPKRPVGNGTKSVGNAARQAKWRAQHPEQHRDQMRTIRAKRKAMGVA